MKITGNQVRADDGRWSHTSHRKRFRRIFVAASVCGRVLSWRRTIPEDNIPRLLFWNKGIELQHALHWVMIDGHSRDIAQHICAKVHLILTVVLISRSIGPWKNSPRISWEKVDYINTTLTLTTYGCSESLNFRVKKYCNRKKFYLDFLWISIQYHSYILKACYKNIFVCMSVRETDDEHSA